MNASRHKQLRADQLLANDNPKRPSVRSQPNRAPVGLPAERERSARNSGIQRKFFKDPLHFADMTSRTASFLGFGPAFSDAGPFLEFLLVRQSARPIPKQDIVFARML
jgi:hypothetical protein